MTDPRQWEHEQECERVLVGRLRQGDPEAFATLMAQYTNRLTRFAFYTVGSRDAAEDVVQQVFVDLWERRATLDPDHLKAYLFRAVRYRALNERTSQAVRQRYTTTIQAEAEAGAIPTVVPSPEERVLTSAAIQAAVKQLSERRRLAIRLRLEEEMTYPEIAESLGVSPMAAQRLVARAMADLRTLLWPQNRQK
jgi:RNA polymerase sigma-70 factor (ECF subfamily)